VGLVLKRRQVLVVSILLGLAPLLLGCGKRSGVARLPVHGTVTLPSGEKLNGSITFIPAKGQPGPGATTRLAEGRYQFDLNNGPTVGPHIVTMTRVVSRASMIDALRKRLPLARSKAEWTCTADVVEDGRYLRDFALQN
jgi:hypothetical protein